MPWRGVWRKLTQDDRERAARLFLEDGGLDREKDAAASEAISVRFHMRGVTVRKMPVAKRAWYLARAQGLPVGLLRDFVVALHLKARLGLVSAFLDAAGVRHEHGVLSDEADASPRSTEALSRAIREIRARHDPGECEVLLDALEALDMPVWANLPSARRTVGDPREAGGQAAEPETPRDAPLPKTTPDAAEQAPQEAPGFTTLDLLVIRTMVHSAAEIHGALPDDALRDLVEEVVHLNGERHSSYFHLGFLDVLQGRPVNPLFPESNAERRGWYLSGAIHAMVRRRAYDGVSAVAAAHPDDVRGLMNREHPEAPRAGPLLFEALWSTDRKGAAHAGLTPATVAGAGPAFMSRLLHEATVLLRRYEASAAAPLLDLVDGATRHLTKAEDPPPAAFVADLRRRQAHVFRLRGDFAKARAILEHLLEQGAGSHTARVKADIGLVQCGVRSLAEVVLPKTPEEMRDVAASLRPGRAMFESAAGESERLGGHGDFVLGVLRLCEGDAGAALPHLERAVAEMQQEDDVYGALGILPRAKLYLGLCLAETLDRAHAVRAADHVGDAVLALRNDVPLYVLQRVLEGLSPTHPEAAQALTERLHTSLGDRLLDAAVAADTLRTSGSLRKALARRVRSKRRTLEERWQDAETLLRESLGSGDHEAGADALDALEEVADDSRSRRRLVALLEDRARYDPVWSVEDARDCMVRLLEAEGDYEKAAALLVLAGHETLAREDERGAAEVRDLLDRLDGYGLHGRGAELRARVERLAPRPAAPADGARLPRVRGDVYFVGGNEVQARYDSGVLAEVRRRWPDVRVVFQHTGWGANWGRDLPTIVKRVQAADVVVVMRFMRTLLGRAIRKACSEVGRPWVPCTGHGEASILRSIGEAVHLMAARPTG